MIDSLKKKSQASVFQYLIRPVFHLHSISRWNEKFQRAISPCPRLNRLQIPFPLSSIEFVSRRILSACVRER